ncbi:hypothetical protein AVEN_270398-1 [Araneus ventricosus]|uniref:Uncharacterized protein n=1 Tax=Araneus ventricosus TaxID=182803 RepID=A0A4Y2LWC8_ARAVE|nr:hypothetical protein AVEN_270398-1 [Araneus ventricosus]
MSIICACLQHFVALNQTICTVDRQHMRPESPGKKTLEVFCKDVKLHPLYPPDVVHSYYPLFQSMQSRLPEERTNSFFFFHSDPLYPKGLMLDESETR